MKDILNVGFIGCGGFVQGSHLPNAAANPKLRVRALCDLQADRLKALEPVYRPDYVTTDLTRLAADPELDLVVIGTGPKVRVEPIRAAAEAGKHIYVEKPMSLGYEDSLEIVRIIRQTGVKLQVGFNRNYSPIMQEARRVYRKMKRGETLISYRIVGEAQLWPKFHQEAVKGGESTIIHELTHIFDLINWLTDSDPRSVFVIGGPSDNNILAMEYPDDVYVTLLSGSCGTEAYPKERMEVFSDHAVLVMDGFMDLECVRIPGESDRHYPLKANPFGPLDIPLAGHKADLRRWRDSLTPAQIEKGYYYDNRPGVGKGHYEALEFLRRCVVEDRPTETGAYRGALATVMGLKSLESLRSGTPVRFDFSFLK
ncbi:MAG TPA: Gfo/Idh/MocA family oxidoreductase [bacterium]|uniref:Glucose--fructose oxidoreductase n=1 Tax=candidate division TA06 bacterium ADurb.Bin417 TaxID=1852828 RepID=A0A1V5MJF0_UNCT6|nr:MAG: Glucose--fructose oxidoreductase precursor [candidate division TA06 bacterium ADurb.Bin417]HNS48010.1 Gfo/Idh/MocA family oxidoreductase [bacterium]